MLARRSGPKRYGQRTVSESLGMPCLNKPLEPQECCRTTQHSRGPHGSSRSTLIRMPFLAATPVPTIMAVGVARARAQGQAMTSTAIPKSSANRKSLLPTGIQSLGKTPVLPAPALASSGVEKATQVCQAAGQAGSEVHLVVHSAFLPAQKGKKGT